MQSLPNPNPKTDTHSLNSACGIDMQLYIGQLRNDHHQMLSKTIPETEAHFLSLLNASSLQYSLALVVAWKWFIDFSDKLRDHFEMEERFVFPYLLGKADSATIDVALDFMRNHHSFEEQLQEYIKVIQNSLNSLHQDLAFRMLIHKLDRLDQELTTHVEAEHLLMEL